MDPINAGTFLFTLVVFGQIFIRAGAYAIDRSCVHYSTDNKDKTSMIMAAMAECNLMLINAAARIIQFSPLNMDNTAQKLFPLASYQDLIYISTKYTTAANSMPWALTNRQSLVADGVTIYCGGDNFVPNLAAGSRYWTDLTSLITVKAASHENNPSAKICQTGYLAMTINNSTILGSKLPNFNIILLCDMTLDKGPSPESTGSQAGVAQIAALPGKEGLYPGKLIENIARAMTISFVLAHEVMHATQPAAFSHGAAEIYGWRASSSLNLATALSNIDNYAYYALAVYLPPEYFVFNGQLGSYMRQYTGQNPFIVET